VTTGRRPDRRGVSGLGSADFPQRGLRQSADHRRLRRRPLSTPWRERQLWQSELDLL